MKKVQNKGFYNHLRKFLRCCPFRIFAKVFSHGATHFAFFVVVGVITAYLWNSNNRENIKPHNIGIHIGWSSSQAQEIQEIQKGYFPKDSIDNVEIHIKLNSNRISEITQGKYHNALEVEFDGKARATNVLGIDRESTYVDSVVFSIYCDPKLYPFETAVACSPFPLGNNEYYDSISPDGKKFVVAKPRILYNSQTKEQADTIIMHQITQKDENNINLTFLPADYKGATGQVTKNHICLYSDAIGTHNDSPYYYYYFNIPKATNAEIKSIDFEIADIVEKDVNGIKYVQGKNLQYNYVYPEPDIIGNGRIVYYSNEKKEAIKKNEGIIVQAVDVDALNRQNNDTFLYSVLVGTGLTFLLDIFVQLIRELRRLHKRRNN